LARPAGFDTPEPALPRWHVATDMLLRNAEVQYVGDLPGATIAPADQYAALAARFGFLSRFGMSRHTKRSNISSKPFVL
jgi:hypothetical protein